MIYGPQWELLSIDGENIEKGGTFLEVIAYQIWWELINNSLQEVKSKLKLSLNSDSRLQ